MLLLCIQGKRAERGDLALEGVSVCVCVCVCVCVWCFMCTHSCLLGESTLVCGAAAACWFCIVFCLCGLCGCPSAVLLCDGPQWAWDRGEVRRLVFRSPAGRAAAPPCWTVASSPGKRGRLAGLQGAAPPLTCCDSVVQKSCPVHSTNDEGSEITVTPYFSVTYVKQVLKNPVSRHPGVVLDGVRTEKGVLSRSPSNRSLRIFTFSAAAVILHLRRPFSWGTRPLISLPPHDSHLCWLQFGPSSLFLHWFCLGLSPALLCAIGPADTCVRYILWTLFFFLSWSWQV